MTVLTRTLADSEDHFSKNRLLIFPNQTQSRSKTQGSVRGNGSLNRRREVTGGYFTS